MVLAVRVACNEEGDGNGGKSNDDKGGRQAMATMTMASEGKQQSTSDGINKGGWWLARER